MDQQKKYASIYYSPKPALILIAASLIIMVFFTLRDWGAYATIMWDEWEYQRYARQLPLPTADLPYYFYYFIYSLTKFCNDRFLECAQFLNALFFVISLPFLYFICRRTLSQNISLVISIASILGGISTYATHFVPEPLYFFMFWLYSWALLKYLDTNPSSFALGLYIGATLALLSLVKLHALFLIPGILLYVLVCASLGLTNIRKPLIVVGVFLITFFSVRFLLGYIIAGTNGLNLLGPAYSDRAESALSFAFLSHIWPFLGGHILALASMYSLPLLAMGTIRLNPITVEDKKYLSLQLYGWCLLLPLIGVAVLYTAHVSQLDPQIEGANGLIRLHMRYYNFLFPLFTVVTATAATRIQAQKFNITKLCISLLISGLAIFFTLNLNTYQLSVNDAPELRGFATIHIFTYLLIAISVGTSLLWAWNAKLAARAYLLLFFPLFTLLGGAAAAFSAHKEMTPTVYHRAGLFAKNHLGENASNMLVIGADFTGLYQSMFYADNPFIGLAVAPEHSCLSLIPASTGKQWLLTFGDYKILSDAEKTFSEDGFKIFHIKPSNIQLIPCP